MSLIFVTNRSQPIEIHYRCCETVLKRVRFDGRQAPTRAGTWSVNSLIATPQLPILTHNSYILSQHRVRGWADLRRPGPSPAINHSLHPFYKTICRILVDQAGCISLAKLSDRRQATIIFIAQSLRLITERTWESGAWSSLWVRRSWTQWASMPRHPCA